MKRPVVLGLLSILLLSADIGFGGNKVLMEQTKERALLLNESVVRRLGKIDNPSTISLIGYVKQRPDGSWQVVIDKMDIDGMIQPGKFPFEAPEEHSTIEYVIFDEISTQGGEK